jgi:broad specificity phosphatase PhoE
MAVIYLVRHGQASFAAADYDDLSPLGREQARVLGSALAARRVRADVVICGRMRRHQQTATECLEAQSLPARWEEDACWDEYDHNEVLAGLDARYRTQGGIAEDLAGHENPKRVFQGIFERAMARWIDAAFHDEYQESFPAFCARVEDGLARLTARLDRKQTAIVFTSGGAISVACRKLLGLGDARTMQLSGALVNASVTKVFTGESGVTLSTLNEHAHFEGGDKRLITYR